MDDIAIGKRQLADGTWKVSASFPDGSNAVRIFDEEPSDAEMREAFTATAAQGEAAEPARNAEFVVPADDEADEAGGPF